MKVFAAFIGFGWAVAVMSVGCVACSHTPSIPNAVIENFAKDYPQVKRAAWHPKVDGDYEAIFSLQGREQTVKYTSTGKLVEREQDITQQEVPPMVLKTARLQLARAAFTEYSRLERPGKPPVFEVEAQIRGKAVDFFYTQDGHRTH